MNIMQGMYEDHSGVDLSRMPVSNRTLPLLRDWLVGSAALLTVSCQGPQSSFMPPKALLTASCNMRRHPVRTGSISLTFKGR